MKRKRERKRERQTDRHRKRQTQKKTQTDREREREREKKILYLLKFKHTADQRAYFEERARDWAERQYKPEMGGADGCGQEHKVLGN